MYFDNSATHWNENEMILVVGNECWSEVYSMQLTETTDLWVVNLPAHWNGPSYMAVLNSSTPWGQGTWGSGNLKFASHYSAAYEGGLVSAAEQEFIFVPESAEDGCTLKLYVKGEEPQPETPEEPSQVNWFVPGNFVDEDWSNPTQLSTKEGGAENTVYASLTLAGGKEYKFKIRKGENEAWYSADGLMTRVSHENWGFSSSEGANCLLMTSIAGSYEFALDTNAMTLTVIYPENDKQATLYDSPVKDNNPDVMLQAFYWAHEGNTANDYTAFGDVKWAALNTEADEIAENFDIVWLAPSQETADYTGYLPMNYSKQGAFDEFDGHHGHSPWGTGEDLKTLIDNLHKGGAKVVADIVLNHTSAGHVDEYAGEDKNWCSWTLNDFGRYGQFQIDRTWITAEDEMFAEDYTPGRIDKWATGDCGNYDKSLLTNDEKDVSYMLGTTNWAYSEYNSTYSRDLAHAKKEVREFSRAYLTWMRDSIGYDGFRYDFMKGIHGSHLKDYNGITAPYFSVAEVFEGNIDKQLGFLYDAGYETYVFDFPGKFTYYNGAIRTYQLQNLKSDYSLIRRDKKHTVTFIDNHDSFHEGSCLYGTANTIDDRQAHQALAFLLSMPGVPCVVYPYWNNYKDVCKAFIHARKAAGVNSESEIVGEWAGSGADGDNYYTALIQGTSGQLFLKLGYDCNPLDAPMAEAPTGMKWVCAWANRDHAGVWYTVPNDTPTSVESTEAPAVANKRIQDGVVYIHKEDKTFTVQGQSIK